MHNLSPTLRNTIARLASIQKGNPTPSDVYVVPEITDIVQGFMLGDVGMIHSQVFPHVGVDLQAGKYPVFSRGAFNRPQMQKRADGAVTAAGGFEVTHVDYAADVWGWHTAMGKQTIANGKRIDIERAASMLCANQALLNREEQWIASYYRTGVWTTDIAGVAAPVGATQTLTWLDADADPIEFLEDLIERAGLLGAGGMYPINRLVFSSDTWRTFKGHPNVIARVNQGQTPGQAAKMTVELLQGILGIERIIIGSAVYTSSGPGAATDTFARFATSGCLFMCHAASAPGYMVPSAGYQIDWTGYTGAGGLGQVMSSWYNQEKASQIFEVEQAYSHHLAAADLGIFVSGLLTAAS